MLYSVSHAGHAILIAKVANIDIEGGTGLVRLRIMNQESLEVIG